MLLKVVFAVVVCFALSSALPLIGDVGQYLPIPAGSTLEQLAGIISNGNLPTPYPPKLPIKIPAIPGSAV